MGRIYNLLNLIADRKNSRAKTTRFVYSGLQRIVGAVHPSGLLRLQWLYEKQ